MRYFLFFTLSILILFFTGCGMSTVYVRIMKPAPLTVPAHIKKVGVINRTLPQNRVLNTIEGVITGEGIGQDRDGVQNAMSGVYDILSRSPRFEVIQTTENIKGSGSGASFPNPLPWRTIEHFCKKYKVDAIISIETYDSDFIVTNGSRNKKKKGEDGNEVTVKEFYAEGVGSVKLGFRLYDPSKKSVIDQHHATHRMDWNATGTSVRDAVAHLINKREAVKRVSYETGARYGRRIAPMQIRVSRSFYKNAKGNEAMKRAGRMAQVGDWQGAADIWERVVQQSGQKTAGKAAYNLALAYEVGGYLEDARDWAMRAYSEYDNKKARPYVNVLNNRIAQENRLREQMGENEGEN